ncbi:MAG: 30S ribosomal protein S6 [Bacteroidales bacterium]|nr:30S ribosomal protein S6 [Bacteroidales bacterium]
MLKQYETVFIATPVLSEQQMKEAVAKYTKLITDNGGEVVYEEDWGLRQLAYPIQHKTSGFYYLIQFQADPSIVEVLETQYFRDERIIRFLTVALDKDAVEYAERRRQNKAKAAAAPKVEEPAQSVEEPVAAPAEPQAPVEAAQSTEENNA